MEIMVYDHNCQKSNETIAAIDYRQLSQTIEKRPEDYVFLLTPTEYTKYQKLNEAFRAGLQGKPMNLDEEDYTKHYQGVFIIASLAVTPKFAQKYKIADMTKQALVGDNHIVFYIDRAHKDMERAQQVLRRIVDFKAEAQRHPEQ